MNSRAFKIILAVFGIIMGLAEAGSGVKDLVDGIKEKEPENVNEAEAEKEESE